jgi:hypothetical protein
VLVGEMTAWSADTPMRAGRAYITSLGTTGLLVASALLLLVVVGALIAFDAWPTSDASAPETVSVGVTERVVKPRGDSSAAERRSARAERRAAAQRRASRERRRRAAEPEQTGDRVISDLPAPGTQYPGPGSGTSAGGGAAVPGGGPARPPGRGGEPTRQLGDTVSNVSPQAGGAVANTGGSVGDVVGGVVSGTPALPAVEAP